MTTLKEFMLEKFRRSFLFFSIMIMLLIFFSIFIIFVNAYQNKSDESAKQIANTINFFINKEMNFVFKMIQSKKIIFSEYPANLDEDTIISTIKNGNLKINEGYIDLTNWINKNESYRVDSGIFFNQHTLKILYKENGIYNYIYSEIKLDKVLTLIKVNKKEKFYLCNDENIVLLSNNKEVIGKNIENLKKSSFFNFANILNKYVFFIKKKISKKMFLVYTVSLNSFFYMFFIVFSTVFLVILTLFYIFYFKISSRIFLIVNYIKSFSEELRKFDKDKYIKETINIKDSGIIELDEINKKYIELIENLQSYSEELSEKYQELDKLSKEIVKRNEQILLSLSKGIELKDKYTLGHSKGVLDLTKKIIYELGIKMDEAYLQQVEIGCILHDTGKIFIPDEILNKPGKLSSEEFEEIKKHPIYGYELLKPISNLKIAKNIVKYHHENWDGSGYPEGLKENEIPFEAQIAAYADIYDAVINRRVYHEAMTKEESIKLIKSLCGKKLNPELFEAFLTAINS